ncbi:MAG: hypothetical protein KGZ25_11380 [Planctomycetes bacterium]|nr:hypothetical protein [Planctomycetota bacterium]
MFDILSAVIILAAVSACCFALGIFSAKKLPGKTAAWLASGVVLLLGLYLVLLHGRLVLAQLFPFSGCIVLGNWIPLAAAILAGIVTADPRLSVQRKTVVAGVLLLLGVAPLARDILSPPPEVQETWSDDGVCLQNKPGTCGACGAATLLRAHGIECHKKEMVRLCLTRRSGTPTLGIYRALKIETRDTPFRVRIGRTDFAGLRNMKNLPVLMSARLDPNKVDDPRYKSEWGWQPGVRHMVLFYGFADDGKVEMADPTVGREQWHERDLRALWDGEMVYLSREN